MLIILIETKRNCLYGSIKSLLASKHKLPDTYHFEEIG